MDAFRDILPNANIHYSKKLKEHFDIMIFIERYPVKRCQGCVKLIASKVNCFLNINDLSEVQLCMSSNSWTWECPHTKDGADHVPLIFLSSVEYSIYSFNKCMCFIYTFCLWRLWFWKTYEINKINKRQQIFKPIWQMVLTSACQFQH